MPEDLPTTYALVDRSALRHNVAQVQARLGGRARLCAVVKGNAYGHGLLETSRLFAELNCDALGVATVEEGLALRRHGLETRILVFHPLATGDIPEALRHGLTVTVTQGEHVAALDAYCDEQSVRAEWQLGVDVGLGRSGYLEDPAEFLGEAERRLGPAWGVWTHLGPGMVPEALPEYGPENWAAATSVTERLRHLADMRESLADRGADRPVFHAAASAALCASDELLWDMVRVGTLLYGAFPAHAPREGLDLRPALSLRTRIIELRTVPTGAPVGYGGEFRARRETQLATVPVGLYHGVGMVPYSSISMAGAAKRTVRAWSGRRGKTFRPWIAKVRGEGAALVGRVSLNECAVDVTDIAGVELGDEVTVPTRMTTLNPVVPRIHVDGE